MMDEGKQGECQEKDKTFPKPLPLCSMSAMNGTWKQNKDGMNALKAMQALNPKFLVSEHVFPDEMPEPIDKASKSGRRRTRDGATSNYFDQQPSTHSKYSKPPKENKLKKEKPGMESALTQIDNIINELQQIYLALYNDYGSGYLDNEITQTLFETELNEPTEICEWMITTAVINSMSNEEE